VTIQQESGTPHPADREQEQEPYLPGLVDRFGLAGNVVVVSDTTNGIGLAMAEAFVDAGAAVVIANEPGAPRNDVAGLLAKRGGRAIELAVDVTEPDDVRELRDTVLSEFGRLDTLVTHVGVAGPVAPMADVDDAMWDHMIDVNVKAPFRMANLLAPVMAEQGGGSIIITSSIAGLRGNAAIGLYGMTKAAILQLARNLAVEWGPRGVRANALAPAFTNANWAGQVLHDSDASARRLAQIPLRRIATPQQIAGTALFLAGPSASAINGQTIVIDGGTLISDGS
jgi:NAD(P)-dependent dehydrogenase (short-subunit alcohol dehydrogenase family)